MSKEERASSQMSTRRVSDAIYQRQTSPCGQSSVGHMSQRTAQGGLHPISRSAALLNDLLVVGPRRSVKDMAHSAHQYAVSADDGDV